MPVCYMIISIGSICWHYFSTGNRQRTLSEIVLGFIDRLELAVSKCIFYYILNYNHIFIIFSILLFMAVMIKCKDSFYWIVGAFPFITAVLFGVVGKLGLYDYLAIGSSLSKKGAITVENFNNYPSYVPIMTVYLLMRY